MSRVITQAEEDRIVRLAVEVGYAWAAYVASGTDEDYGRFEVAIGAMSHELPSVVRERGQA